VAWDLAHSGIGGLEAISGRSFRPPAQHIVFSNFIRTTKGEPAGRSMSIEISHPERDRVDPSTKVAKPN
jgi:hypothetical protein